VNEYEKDNCSEWYDIPPDFKSRGIKIQLPTSAAREFRRKKGKILMPFIKSCIGWSKSMHGTGILRPSSGDLNLQVWKSRRFPLQGHSDYSCSLQLFRDQRIGTGKIPATDFLQPLP
jgi:hypothetical protein